MNSKQKAPSSATAKPRPNCEAMRIDRITDVILSIANTRNFLSDELDVAVAQHLTTFELKDEGKDISSLVAAIDALGRVMTALDSIHARASRRERDANAPVKDISQEALEKDDATDPYDSDRLKADIAADPHVEERAAKRLADRYVSMTMTSGDETWGISGDPERVIKVLDSGMEISS